MEAHLHSTNANWGKHRGKFHRRRIFHGGTSGGSKGTATLHVSRRKKRGGGVADLSQGEDHQLKRRGGEGGFGSLLEPAKGRGSGVTHVKKNGFVNRSSQMS